MKCEAAQAAQEGGDGDGDNDALCSVSVSARGLCPDADEMTPH